MTTIWASLIIIILPDGWSETLALRGAMGASVIVDVVDKPHPLIVIVPPRDTESGNTLVIDGGVHVASTIFERASVVKSQIEIMSNRKEWSEK